MENNQFIPIEDRGEIVLYQPDDNVRLEVRLQDDTVWLTQQQMTELFKTTKQNVSLHINNIFREGELMPDSVVKESLTTAGDGKNYRTKYILAITSRRNWILRSTTNSMSLSVMYNCHMQYMTAT